MSEPDWPALFRSMQDQLGMLQAEFIQLKDTSVSKASLHDTLQSALIAQSQHLGTVMQTAVQEALGTRVPAEPAQAAEGQSALPRLPRPVPVRTKIPSYLTTMGTVMPLSSSSSVLKFSGPGILPPRPN